MRLATSLQLAEKEQSARLLQGANGSYHNDALILANEELNGPNKDIEALVERQLFFHGLDAEAHTATAAWHFYNFERILQ